MGGAASRPVRAILVVAQDLPPGVVFSGRIQATATRKRAPEPKQTRYVLFAVDTGLRPDETWRLEFRDVTIVDDENLGKTILEIEVRGKRGVGYCKSMPSAVRPFERVRSRLRPPRIYGVNTPTEILETAAEPSGTMRVAFRLAPNLEVPFFPGHIFAFVMPNRNLAPAKPLSGGRVRVR